MRGRRPGNGHDPRAAVLTDADSGPGASPARLHAWVSGRVQGVGFRAWARTRASSYGLAGWARNLGDGRVEVIAEGSRERCERLLADLRSPAAPGQVRDVVAQWQDGTGLAEFRVD